MDEIGRDLSQLSINRFDVFEKWLIDAGAKFPDLELRTYDTPTDDSTNSSDKESKLPEKTEQGSDTVNDKGEANSDKLLIGKGGDKGTKEYDEDKEMRGVHAKTDIPAGNTCVVVPRSCLITVEMGRATPLGQTISLANLDLDAPKHVYLMLFLLQDRKNPDSFFKPYYDILPPKLSNMPIFWSKQELAYLQGSYLLRQIEERRAAIVTDYEMICAVAPSITAVATLEEFMWARMCVCSRNFGLVINGVRTSALVPHADMLNHYRPRETKWTYDNSLQAFTITTLQGISGGDQIYDSYGQKCNHRFLLNYGFAVEMNVEQDGFCPNEVPVVITLEQGGEGGGGEGEEEDKHLADESGVAGVAGTSQQDGEEGGNDSEGGTWNAARAKLELWTRDGSSMSKRVRVCVSNNDNTKSMMSLLRVKVAGKEELKAIMGGGPYMYRSAKDIRFGLGVNNETLALEELSRMTKKMMMEYPTTLEEDVKALAEGEYGEKGGLRKYSNERHARIQVKGEKEVLRYFERLADTGRKGLACKDEEFEVLKEGLEGGERQYVMEVVAGIRKDERRRERREKE
ncbi:hypothetical protein TrCOL_g4538 [Triparma columacea]|uniref:SET domain-containing protein n=1 Tax=Triparma columacea TaxID=722753 RepID=A0A9W7LAD8_9STRA|nr:hypothetical protein TrCOL_g4538 [Triparma columacea]